MYGNNDKAFLYGFKKKYLFIQSEYYNTLFLHMEVSVTWFSRVVITTYVAITKTTVSCNDLVTRNYDLLGRNYDSRI